MPSRWRSAWSSAAPAEAEHLDLAGVRLEQPLEDLDGRRLAGAVRAEQAEALAGRDLEVEAGDGDDVAVALLQAAADARPRRFPRRSRLASSHGCDRLRFC